MEIVAVSNIGRSVDVTVARSMARLRTYSTCGCNLALRIHATDGPASHEADASMDGHAGRRLPQRLRRHARWTEARSASCNAAALDTLVSTIGLSSNPAAELDFDRTLFGRRPQGAIRPLPGGGVVQRIVLAGKANIALPPIGTVVGNVRHFLSARRAQLAARI